MTLLANRILAITKIDRQKLANHNESLLCYSGQSPDLCIYFSHIIIKNFSWQISLISDQEKSHDFLSITILT